MAEWKVVTQMAKQVKIKFGQCTSTVVNRHLISYLNQALFKALRRNTDDLRGRRSIYLSAHKEVLDAIIYYYYKPFGDIMKCRYEVDTGPDRKSVTVTLLNLIPRDQIMPPAEATHFQFCLSIGAVCDFVYQPEDQVFAPVYNFIRMTHSLNELESEWIPVNASAMGNLTYTVQLPDDFVLEEDMTVLRTVGIVFGKMTSGVEPLKRDRGSVEFLGAI